MLAVRLVEQLAGWRVLSMADKKAVQLVGRLVALKAVHWVV